jgi:hypothetical protein
MSRLRFQHLIGFHIWVNLLKILNRLIQTRGRRYFYSGTPYNFALTHCKNYLNRHLPGLNKLTQA